MAFSHELLASENNECLDFSLILENLNRMHKEIQTLDNTTKKKLYLSLNLLDSSILKQKRTIYNYPELSKIHAEHLCDMFDPHNNVSLNNYDTEQSMNLLKFSSDSQKKMLRYINKAFYDEPRIITPEYKVSIYSIDVLVDLKDRNYYNLALEVSNPIVKDFRTGYLTPGPRIREKTLKKLGYYPLEIDTTKIFEGSEDAHDEIKINTLKEFMLDNCQRIYGR